MITSKFFLSFLIAFSITESFAFETSAGSEPTTETTVKNKGCNTLSKRHKMLCGVVSCLFLTSLTGVIFEKEMSSSLKSNPVPSPMKVCTLNTRSEEYMNYYLPCKFYKKEKDIFHENPINFMFYINGCNGPLIEKNNITAWKEEYCKAPFKTICYDEKNNTKIIAFVNLYEYKGSFVMCSQETIQMQGAKLKEELRKKNIWHKEISSSEMANKSAQYRVNSEGNTDFFSFFLEVPADLETELVSNKICPKRDNPFWPGIYGCISRINIDPTHGNKTQLKWDKNMWSFPSHIKEQEKKERSSRKNKVSTVYRPTPPKNRRLNTFKSKKSKLPQR